MPAELLSPVARITDADANPYSGAKWYFYATGTTTPQAVYADADLAVSLGATVTADSGGKFVPIYFDMTKVYRGVCENASGSVTLHDIDPINLTVMATLSASGGSSLIGIPGAGELVDLIAYTTPEQCGYVSGDASEAIDDAIALAVSLGYDAMLLGGKTYPVAHQINVPKNFTLISLGAILDGTVGFDVSDGLSVLNVGSDTTTALPALASDESAGDTLVSFASAHGLVAGDVFAIYDPTDYSFSSARSYYREGEFCEVAEVTSSTQVRLSNGLYDGYAAATVDCYKLDVGTFNVIGALEVRVSQPSPADATIGIKLTQVVRSNIEGLRVSATGGAYAAIEAYRCYKTNLGYFIRQEGESVGGDCYGLLWSNCQQCIGTGHASSTRHALSHGGAGDPGDIPTRFIHNVGTWETTGEGEVWSVDVHGNCDAISFDGTARGGINMGGRGVRFRGTLIADPTTGVAVTCGEVKAPNFDFAGVRIIGNGVDPQLNGQGIVDFGGLGASDVDDMESGTIDFSNCVIEAADCERAFSFRLRNTDGLAGERHSINLRGATIIINPAAATPIYVTNEVGVANWHLLDMRDMDLNTTAAPAFDDVDKVYAPMQKGSAGVAVTNAQAAASLEVTFSTAFPSGYIPSVQASSRANATNGAYVIHHIHNVTETRFFITVLTIDGTNFSAGRTDTYDWTAQ